ncbi:MAG: hypothetical protein WDZ79_00905 [Candidatus Paceibacterota bacterium]
MNKARPGAVTAPGFLLKIGKWEDQQKIKNPARCSVAQDGAGDSADGDQ